MGRDDTYLLDILIAARKARSFVEGITQQQFEKSELVQNAVMRMLQIIGEAATKLSTDFKAAQPKIPWADVVGMRHRLVHDYFGIDPLKVWETVEHDLPQLISWIEPLVPPEKP